MRRNHLDNLHRGLKVHIGTFHALRDHTGIHHPERRQNHRNSEEAPGQAVGAGGVPVAIEFLHLDLLNLEVVVEPSGLRQRELEQNLGRAFQLLDKGREFLAQGIEGLLLRLVSAIGVEAVQPVVYGIDAEEYEARKEPVFRVVDEGLHLLMRAGENGGQTTASIYYTKKNDKADISSIYVQMKISVVKKQEQFSDIVSRISKYANTQNKVNNADFSANNQALIEFEKLSRYTLTPLSSDSPLQTYWFFERARGQYKTMRQKEGFTKSRQAAFDKKYPKNQVLTKTDIAKYINAYDEVYEGKKLVIGPHVVARGNEKNYARFINNNLPDNLKRINNVYFEDTIAKAILFKTADKRYGTKAGAVHIGELKKVKEHTFAYDLSDIADDLIDPNNPPARRVAGEDQRNSGTYEHEMGIIRSIPPSLWNKIAEWGQASGHLAIHYQSAARDTAYKLKYNYLISETDRKRAMAIYDIVCQYNIELLDEADELAEKDRADQEAREAAKEEKRKASGIDEVEITLDPVKEMVDWDKRRRILEDWKWKVMNDVANGKKPLTDTYKYTFWLNLQVLRKKGFPK